VRYAALILACLALNAADFRNVAREAGLTHIVPNGGTTSKQFIIETTGSGVAFIDYDNDGLPDIFVVSGPEAPSRMYRNEGGGKFRDVSESLGLTRKGWGQGVCAGDFDNDGFTDLFVTYWGQNALYRNAGGKHFDDVTAKMGLSQDRVRYNTGCAFLDYDNDGKLDLFVSNYLKFDFASTPKPGANPYCFYRGIAVNCGPRGLPFDRNLLYHNTGAAFKDVSDESGISKPDGNYSLGVLTGDFNGDGLTDIYVACDQTPSILYINQGNGTFSDEALMRGTALDDNGKALSGMGVASADYLHQGLPSIFRTNFSDELETLYRNRGKGEFEDASVESGLGQNTRFVGWGCGFFDFDNDGWPDLLLVNGHAFPEVDKLNIDVHYRERAILYRNDHGHFADISETSGPGILERHSSRGAAFADYDNDGVVEVLVNNQGEAPSLLRQPMKPANHWVTLRLEGVKSNRSAIGARIRVTAGSLVQTGEVRSGGSYLSQSDLRLHFGLGSAGKVDRVEITWPGGKQQIETTIAADRVVTVRER
jgi:enediyne biosynthesis protein E4